MVAGFGIFNVVEGIIDHQILGIHRVNETAPESQWIYWDIGFLIWGAAMIVIGWLLWRAAFGSPADAEPEEAREASPADLGLRDALPASVVVLFARLGSARDVR